MRRTLDAHDFERWFACYTDDEPPELVFYCLRLCGARFPDN
jgi:hypothetical protein